jgi:transcriptional regulator with XRE-family HTH domain
MEREPEPRTVRRHLPRLTAMRAERLKRGIPLYELASLSGIAMSTLSRAERDEAVLSPSQEVARRQALALLGQRPEGHR